MYLSKLAVKPRRSGRGYKAILTWLLRMTWYNSISSLTIGMGLLAVTVASVKLMPK
jgi:hypothetical protein